MAISATKTIQGDMQKALITSFQSSQDTLDKFLFVTVITAAAEHPGTEGVLTRDLANRIKSCLPHRFEIAQTTSDLAHQIVPLTEQIHSHLELGDINAFNNAEMASFSADVSRWQAFISEGQTLLNRVASDLSTLNEQDWQEIKGVFEKSQEPFSDSFKAMAQRR